MAMLVDRPERCTINNFLSHAGLSTKQWGYAAYLDQNKIPSCDAFSLKYLQALSTCPISTCRQCGDWNYNATSSYIN